MLTYIVTQKNDAQATMQEMDDDEVPQTVFTSNLGSLDSTGTVVTTESNGIQTMVYSTTKLSEEPDTDTQTVIFKTPEATHKPTEKTTPKPLDKNTTTTTTNATTTTKKAPTKLSSMERAASRGLVGKRIANWQSRIDAINKANQELTKDQPATPAIKPGEKISPENEMEKMHHLLYYWMALALKLNTLLDSPEGTIINFNSSSLYTKLTEEKVHYEKWPQRIAEELQKHVKLSK